MRARVTRRTRVNLNSCEYSPQSLNFLQSSAESRKILKENPRVRMQIRCARALCHGGYAFYTFSRDSSGNLQQKFRIFPVAVSPPSRLPPPLPSVTASRPSKILDRRCSRVNMRMGYIKFANLRKRRRDVAICAQSAGDYSQETENEGLLCHDDFAMYL